MVTVIQERHIMLDMEIGDVTVIQERHIMIDMEIFNGDSDTRTPYNARDRER